MLQIYMVEKMEQTVTLSLQNKEKDAGYTSDVVASVFYKNRLIGTFGLTYGEDLAAQSLYTAKCINYLKKNSHILVEYKEGVRVPELINPELIEKYIKAGEGFSISPMGLGSKQSSTKLALK